eukprot:8433016-Pyramimonas_sp.AAC.1
MFPDPLVGVFAARASSWAPVSENEVRAWPWGEIRRVLVRMHPAQSNAVLELLVHGWATDRRFQCDSPCLLGCLPSAVDPSRDSFSHYWSCPRFLAILCSIIRAPSLPGCPVARLGLAPPSSESLL